MMWCPNCQHGHVFKNATCPCCGFINRAAQLIEGGDSNAVREQEVKTEVKEKEKVVGVTIDSIINSSEASKAFYKGDKDEAEPEDIIKPPEVKTKRKYTFKNKK